MSDIPGLPSTVDVTNEAELQRVLQAILQAMNVWAGRKGNPRERLLSWGDANDQQILRIDGNTIYNPNLPVEQPLLTQPTVLDNVTVDAVLVTVDDADVWIEF